MGTGEIRRWVGQSRRLREGRIFVLQTSARLTRNGRGAPIFLNSIPKAGTHLLMQALDEMEGVRTTGVHLIKADVVRAGTEPVERSREVDWTKVRRILSRSARPGQYITAHTWAHPELFDLLDELGYAQLFVIRDPRDIVVSQSTYVKRLGRHPDHKRFASALSDDQQRYRAIIEGYVEDDQGPAGVSLAERLVGFAPWLERQSVLTCRFEDLIGPSGGGSADRQVKTLETVADTIGAPLGEGEANDLSTRVFSTRSATFNKGRIGGWREIFDSETTELFDALVPADLIRRYGYAA